MSEPVLSAADLAAAGLDLLTRGKLAVAASLARRAVAADPAAAQAWRLATEVARGAGALDEARAAAARWRQLAPADGEADTVLAALSERPPAPDYAGLKPVPFVLIDDFLPAERKAEAVDWLMEHAADLVEASVVKADGQRKLDGDSRSARVGFEPAPLKAWLQPMIAQLVPRCLAAFGIEAFTPERYELHVTASYHGDFYTAHRDYVPEQENQIQTRRITYVYYFQPPGGAFKDGHLRLYDWQGAEGAASRQRYTTVLPLDNRMVLFPSHALHEVCRVVAPSGRVEDGRFTLNGWVHRARGAAAGATGAKRS
jgi:hypothetical protein